MKKVHTYYNFAHLLILFTTLTFPTSEGLDLDPETLERVLEDFLRIENMMMYDYSHWWSPCSFEDCAKRCLNDKKMFCRSFSYSLDADACSTFESARYDAPEKYGVPSLSSDGKTADFEWNYFERKSEKYQKLEKKMAWLKNLTEINMTEASAVLNSLAGMIESNMTTLNTSVPGNFSAENTVLPSELEIAGQSMLHIMKLNPLASAPLEGVKDFAEVVFNVSSALTKPSYADAWQAVQKNPASPGSSAVVTSAEQISQEVSAKLLSTQNATSGIKAEADSIGFWMDFEPKQNEDQNTNVRLSEAFRRLFGSSISNQIRILSPYYTFPNKEVMPARVTLPPTSMWTTGIPVNSEEEGDFFQDSITLPRAALGTKCVVTNVRYKNLDHSMPTRKSDDRDLPKGVSVRFSKVNSAVLTTSVHPRPDKAILENDPVIIVFKHHREARGNLTENANATQQNETSVPSKKPPPYYRTEKTHCVFWKEGNDEKDGGAWSTDGCIMSSTNETHTVCSCTHLTSFAVLLQIVEYNMEDELSRLHLQVLGIISKVGCVFSLIGVSIMCAAFVKLKFHTDNMKIHFHLGLAVGLADLVFIFEELAEDSRAECILVTILLYYFNMAVLAWMLIEGVHLYSQVVVVFVSARRWVKYYVGAGWGVPLFIMAISMGVRNVELGTYGVCWLSPADNSIWAFAAPALLVILINTVILITVVRVIINLQPAKSNRVKAAKLRNAVKGSIFLFPLLGTTWLFGLLSLSQETLLFQYIFALTNSLQGFFLFVFHCLCNSEVREDARRHKWFGAKKVPLGLGSPPPQSSLLSLSVTNGIRRFRNSISFEMPTSSTGESDNNSEEESSKNGNFGKLLSLFPRVFVAKMPETIEEEINEKDVEGMDTSKPPLVVGKSSPTGETVTEDKKQPEVSERPLQLPGMPVKNDRITLPLETQKKLDQMLSERMANSATKELCKESEMNMKKDVEMPVFDEADEKRKMEMSYDSGLNSIDNESILDEEDDVWMANQQKKLQEQQDRSPGGEFPKQADTQN